MYRILFERTVGKLSHGRMTGRWVGTVKIDNQKSENRFMLNEMD